MTPISATKRERAAIRAAVLKNDKVLIPLEQSPDGFWFIDIGGIVFEGGTPGDALRYLAAILEES